MFFEAWVIAGPCECADWCRKERNNGRKSTMFSVGGSPGWISKVGGWKTDEIGGW